MNMLLENAKKVLSGEENLSLDELAKLVEHLAFSASSSGSREEQECAEATLKLFKKLLSETDLDDDEEASYIFHTIGYVLGADNKNTAALDLLAEAGASFTEPMYYQGRLTNFRDYILEWDFSLEILEKMTQLGIDLNEPLIKGQTPAFIVAHRNRMVSWGSRNEPEEAFAAAAKQYFSVESMEALNADGISAAHMAVQNNHFEMLQAMLQKGINVNLTEDQPQVAGTTLLHTACAYGFPELVKMLMAAGADDTLQNVEEETAAHIAVSEKIRFKKISLEERAEMIRALEHIDIVGKNGRTPLMTAQNYDLHGSYLLTPVFLEKGADVNRTDNAGNTALLLHAEWSCDTSVVKAMVKAGLDVNIRNKDGNTALHLALKNRNSEAARYLIKKGADYNTANEKQLTPLQIAVEKGLDEVLPLMGL